MGAGGTFIRTTYTWHYELAAASGQKGVIAIGPARIRIDGREMRSNVVNVRVGAGAAPAPGAPASGASAAAEPSAQAPAPPPASAGASNFIRIEPDKVKAYVGEQVTVSWQLYLTQNQDKYEPITESRTDGFWSEDLTRAPDVDDAADDRRSGLPGRHDGQARAVSAAAGQADDLADGAEIAQMDFFGSRVRRQRLKSDPIEIEAVPLPKEGQPAGFESTNVGKFTIEARADRATIGVGDALTLTIDIRGQGNLRNVRAPALPRLEGWKTYEPKVTVNLDPGEVVSGTKTVEYLIMPERPGTTMIPSFELAYFDPATKQYAVAKSDPLRIEVTGSAAGDKTVAAGGPGPHGMTGAAGVENVISTEIRPIRARAALNRDLGATFYRSRPFLGVLLLPPLGLVLGRFFARLRERLAQDSQRNRRRRVRQMVRQRLGAAEDHRDAGRRSAFYIEIDRVVRDVLAARLRRPVTGLRMDELRDLLLARGMPADEAGRVIAELESCDLARFAPAEAGGAASREQMNAALERAGELIVAIDKAPLREEAAT